MKIVKKTIEMNKWFFLFIIVETSITTHIVCLWIYLGEESNNFFLSPRMKKIT
jgi:hypothetical protein